MSGLLGGDADAVHYTGVLFTRAWLIWACSGAKPGTMVSWARLVEIEVETTSPLLDKLPAAQAATFGHDFADGLSIFGMINHSPERGSLFIEMDGGQAAHVTEGNQRGGCLRTCLAPLVTKQPGGRR